MFKNITFLRFAPAVGLDVLCRLGDAIKMLPLRELLPSDMGLKGFDPAQPHWVGMACYVTIAFRDRIISAAMVAEILDKRCKAIDRDEGRKLGGRERKRMREEIIVDLMPHAPIVTKRIDCLIHCGENWIAINTGSSRVAENCIGLLRMALGSFPAAPLAPELSPRMMLTAWLRQEGQALSAMSYQRIGWSLGYNCKLIGEDEAVATYKSQSLVSQEIADNLEAGKHVKQLGVVIRENVSATITADLVFKSVRFLEDAGITDAEDIESQLALQALEIEIVARDLFALFQCEEP